MSHLHCSVCGLCQQHGLSPSQPIYAAQLMSYVSSLMLNLALRGVQSLTASASSMSRPSTVQSVSNIKQPHIRPVGVPVNIFFCRHRSVGPINHYQDLPAAE